MKTYYDVWVENQVKLFIEKLNIGEFVNDNWRNCNICIIKEECNKLNTRTDITCIELLKSFANRKISVSKCKKN